MRVNAETRRHRAGWTLQRPIARLALALTQWLLIAFAVVGALAAQAQSTRNGLLVTVPNGYANLVADDLQVETTAGAMRWMRLWDGQEWRFNPQWESLSQSWKNLTGSQTADTTASTTSSGGSTAVASGLSAGSSGGGGCWVWVDEDWSPSVGSAVIGGIPEVGPLIAVRTTPFNRLMGEASADYSPPQVVSVDYASLCGGSVGGGGAAISNTEGIRKANELYLGDNGRYAFNNRSVLEKRAVLQLPAGAATDLDRSLASGRFTVSPTVNDKGYRWIDKAGDWIDYNTQGQVVAWGDRNDNLVWLVRDTAGIVRGVVDANGHVVLTLHYTGDLITEVRDYPVGVGDMAARTVRYAYDARNRLFRITDARGNVVSYDYDAGNHIIKITDPESRAELLAYSGDTVRQRSAPDGGVTDYLFEYDDANKQFISKITGPDTASGRRLDDLTHNRAGKLVRRIVNGRTDEELRYDSGARVELNTNARGFSTRITRNEFDQVVRIDHPDGAVRKFNYSALHLGLTDSTDELGVVTRYGYDGRGNVTRMTEAAGTADERVTDYGLNALGQIVRFIRRGRTEPGGAVTPDAEWQIEYDALGLISKTIDPEGHVRRYAFDRAGNLLRFTDPRGNANSYAVDAHGNLTSTTDALGRVSTWQYDKVGNLVAFADARTKLTQATYDGLNRRTQTTTPVGGIYRLQYNGQGLPVAEIDEDGRSSSAEFDNFLRLTRQIDGLGNVTQYGYNLADGSAAGTLGALFDPTSTQYPTFSRQQRYDERERLTSDTLLNPNSLGTEGLVSSTVYDKRGQVTSDTDPNGKTRFYAYDALGRLTEMTDSLGNKTKAAYDLRGNLVQITDALGNANRFEFDRNDRIVKEILPLGQTTGYSYDAAGNLAERTDPNGRRAAFSYDAANRLVQVRQYDAGSTLARTTSYTWDPADNLSAWTDTDHVRGQTSSASATFDDANRKSAETLTYPAGNTLSYSYNYSAAGRKTQLTWPDGTVIGYGYSLHGELESVDIPGEGSISVNQFKWFEPARVTLPGGSTQERTLDGLLNLEGLKVRTPGQQTVLSVANTFGKVQELQTSNRTDAASGANGASSTRNSSFSYDDETRLTQAVVDAGAFGTETESFTLDALGNRIAHSRVSGAWTYDANNRLIQRGTGANATTYAYDNAGNLTQRTEPGNRVSKYLYDTQNRLAEVRDGSDKPVARYGYDPLDRRIWREQYSDGTGVPLPQALRTYYLYADEGLIAEATQPITLNADRSVTATGTPQIATQYGPRPNAEFTTGMLFIKTKNSNDQDSFAYYHHDQIGTPVQATDKQGNVVWAASYNAFGKATVTTPTATADKPTINSGLRLPGQIEDSETGYHYNYRRYYDPGTGRYLTQDPIGLAGGDNRYRYVESNPLNLFDPTGECPMCAAYAVCMAECMLEDVVVNTITGDCNNFGSSAKGCAASCAIGMGLGRAANWAKKAWDRLPCSINSFPEGTLVHVQPQGASVSDAGRAVAALKPIEQLKVGDKVLAFSEWKSPGADLSRDERLSYQPITDIFSSNKLQTIVQLSLDDGRALLATDGHPIKTSEGWRDASLLKVGDHVVVALGENGALDERFAVVVAVSKEVKTLPALNIEVANAHTYFAGILGVLVHNHGNSKSCKKFQYLYEIFQKNTGQTKKYGITSTPPNKSGNLPRPKSQLGPNDDYRVIDTASNRADILQKEKNAVQNYQNSNNGNRPPNQKRP